MRAPRCARRDNLKSSIAELAAQIEEAKAALEEAQAEMQKLKSLDGPREGDANARIEAAPRLSASPARAVAARPFDAS